MNNTNLDRVVARSGLTGLMPPKRLGRRIGMPNTIVRSFQAPRPIASPSPPGSHPPSSHGALSTLKLAWGGLAGAPMQPSQPGFGPRPGGGLGGTLQTQLTGAQRPGITPIPQAQPGANYQMPPSGMTPQPGGYGGSSYPGMPGGRPMTGGDVGPGGGFSNPRLPPQQPSPFKPVPAPFGQPGTNPPTMRGPLGMGRGMNFRQPGMRMAMGGPVDFEQVLGNTGGVHQAMQAYGSPMRLAEGGSSWLGPFQHARIAGAAGAAATEQRQGKGPEDLISQAPNYAGTVRALGTPGEQEEELPQGKDQSWMAGRYAHGQGWEPTPKWLRDLAHGALQGAKR